MFKFYNHNLDLKGLISKPIEDENLLLTGQCHVDHEGFDLNEIELQYYKANGYSLYHEPTYYKDGGQQNGTNAILCKWMYTEESVLPFILDHSHFVIRYPFVGNARQQVLKYAKKRPELYRLVSSVKKFGLDFCLDYLNTEEQKIEPIVHIEWDYNDPVEFEKDVKFVQYVVNNVDWNDEISYIRKVNRLIGKDAFYLADLRAQSIFGRKSYKLIPTL